MTLRLGRAPKVSELAEELGLTTEAVLEAMEAGAAYRATSLDARRPGDEEGLTLGDRLPSEEAASRPAEVRVLVGQLLDTLPEREAEILRLRFYDELTQTEIAERVGISQMHVSRLIRRCLLDLRAHLER
jgi:RNA polymerase sigma-B factor